MPPGPDTAAVFDGACRVRDVFPGISVVILNHEGYTVGRQRGHSNQPSDADFLVRFAREKSSSVGKWSVEKSKDGEGVSGAYRLSVVELGVKDVDGEPLTSMVLDPVDGRPIESGNSTNNGAEKPLNRDEQRTFEALRSQLAKSANSDDPGLDAVQKADLREWVEKRSGVERKHRRGVVNKGLKGLKERGIVEVERENVFLLRERH